MSRRHDSPLDDDIPGAAAAMHELNSDSEEGAGEEDIDVDEDDIDHELSAQMQQAAALSPARSPGRRGHAAAAEAAKAATSRAAIAAPASSSSSSSGLHMLPSYLALISSINGMASNSSGSSNSSSNSGGSVSLASLTPSPGSAAARDADENRGYLQDETGDDGEGDEDDAPLSAAPGGRGGAGQPNLQDLMLRAQQLESRGHLRKASHYYLFVLEQLHGVGGSRGGRSVALGGLVGSHQQQDVIATCLRRLGDICYRGKKYTEALQFRTAERMLYDARLLRVVQTDAEKQTATAAKEDDATATTDAVLPSARSARSIASGSAATASSSPSTSSSRAFFSAPSADPSPLPRTPLTPAALLADEDRALRLEQLARVFFDEKNISMARSYALKAIELRRKIKEKWGDPSTMTKDQLQLHQLAVAGQEQYESTLREFKAGGNDTESLSLHATASSGSVGAPGGSDGGEARTRALQASMAASLQALSSGQLASVRVGAGLRKVAASSSAAAAAAAAAIVAEDALTGDEHKDESADTLRQRRAASAARATVTKQQRKQVAFEQPQDVSSAAPPRTLSKRRALLFSLLVGLSVALFVALGLLYFFQDSLFPMQPERPSSRHMPRSGNAATYAHSTSHHHAYAQQATAASRAQR